MDRSRTSSTVSTPHYYYHTTSTSTSTSSSSSQDDAGTYPYNGKVLLAAVILLSTVVFFVILLHVYARWFLGRHRPVRIASVVSELRLQTLVGHIGDHELPCFSKGLDPKVVASLPTFVCEATGSSSSTTTLDCVVCLSVMEEGEVGRELPTCRHVFHVECVDMWLLTHSTCPLCRAVVAGEAVEEEEDVVVVVVDEEVHGGVDERNYVTVDIDTQVDSHGTSVMKGDVSSSSTTTSTSCSSSLSCCSLKRMVSKSRSESKVFPSGTV